MSFIDSIKDKLEEWKDTDISFSLKNFSLKDFLEMNKKGPFLVFILSIFLYGGLFFYGYKNYKEYKKNKTENIVLKYNNDVLNYIYKKRKEEVKKINKIKIPEIPKKLDVYRLSCLFLNLNKFDLVNKKFFIQYLKYDNKTKKYQIGIQGVK